MNFSGSLDRGMEEIKRPKTPPVGHYNWQITKHPELSEFTARSGATFERLTYNVKAISACDDVDPDELADFGEINGYPCRKVFLFADSEEDATGFERSRFSWRLFCESLGIDAENKSGSEALAESVGCQFMGELKHRLDETDPEIIYTEIGNTSVVE